MKKIVIPAIIVIFALIIGFFIGNIFQISLKDRIYVGQMGMDNPEIVVGRNDHFEASPSPTLDVQLLQSVFHRWGNGEIGKQKLVVRDNSGNEVLSKTIDTTHYSTVVSLHPLQQTKGTYRLDWLSNNDVIASKTIAIN